MEKKLQRNSGDAVLGGVASGLASYLNIDKTIIRVIWVASLLLPIPPSFFWTGALYVVLWLVLPDGPVQTAGLTDGQPRTIADTEDEKKRRDQTIKVAGIALLGFGAVMLMNQLPMWYQFREYMWPIGLIVAGGYLLLRQRDDKAVENKDATAGPVSPPPAPPADEDPTPVVLFGKEENGPGNDDSDARDDNEVIKVN